MTFFERVKHIFKKPPEGNIFIRQIFYDETSRAQLDPGFIPLDNTANDQPDWYEFWVIRQFLKKNRLTENAWYGFLSPKFMNRTGVCSKDAIDFIKSCDQRGNIDVVIFPTGWDQNCYFLNPFEQGELWHPGLMEASQYVIDNIDLPIDTQKWVTTFATAVFSNYVVAKPIFWKRWLKMADAFFELLENDNSPIAQHMRSETEYGPNAHQVPMKVFIQERLTAALVTCGFRVESAVNPHAGFHALSPLFCEYGKENPEIMAMLERCDALKTHYLQTKDEVYLREYFQVRAAIPTRTPIVPKVLVLT